MTCKWVVFDFLELFCKFCKVSCNEDIACVKSISTQILIRQQRYEIWSPMCYLLSYDIKLCETVSRQGLPLPEFAYLMS